MFRRKKYRVKADNEVIALTRTYEEALAIFEEYKDASTRTLDKKVGNRWFNEASGWKAGIDAGTLRGMGLPIHGSIPDDRTI